MINIMSKYTTEKFIELAKKVHGTKYDYSKVKYENSKTKVCIICPKHGEFWQKPASHLNGRGCQECYNERRGEIRKKTENEFLNELKNIFSDKYDYSKLKYVDDHTKVCLICPEHGEFWMTPSHLLGRKKGCPKCSREITNKNRICTTENFIEKAKKIHGDYYDYSLVDYKGAKIDVEIICPKHGIFLQKPNYHLSGNGCPKCKMSKIEFDILTELNKNGVRYEFHAHPKFLNGLELDFYLPEINTAIECQGRQHYEPVNYFGGIEGFKNTVIRDKEKKRICSANNIEILYYTKEEIVEENVFTQKEKIIEKITQKYNERYSS